MPSRKKNKNLLHLPTNTTPLGTRCLTVFVPDDPEWISLFTGVIYRLGQQVWYDRDATHAAKVVADRWKLVYLDLMNRMRVGDPCEVIDMFDIRLNPTNPCELQKTFDGETWIHAAWLDECFKNTIKRNPKTGETGWYDGIDFYHFPEGEWVDNPPDIFFPPPREGNDLCIASASAARVLQQLYRETWDWFNTSLTLGVIDLAKQIVYFTEIIMQGVTSLYDMVAHAEDLYLESEAFVSGGFPDTELENVQNILYCRSAADSEGRVTFDYAGVVADFGAETGDPYGGLNFLLQLYLGEDGLNTAGNIIAVPDADCGGAPCEVLDCSWSTNFDTLPAEVTILQGTYTTVGGDWCINGFNNYVNEQSLVGAQAEVKIALPAPCNIGTVSYQARIGGTAPNNGNHDRVIKGWLEGVLVFTYQPATSTGSAGVWQSRTVTLPQEYVVDEVSLWLGRAQAAGWTSRNMSLDDINITGL